MHQFNCRLRTWKGMETANLGDSEVKRQAQIQVQANGTRSGAERWYVAGDHLMQQYLGRWQLLLYTAGSVCVTRA